VVSQWTTKGGHPVGRGGGGRLHTILKIIMHMLKNLIRNPSDPRDLLAKIHHSHDVNLLDSEWPKPF
jgi:hypothetical protein